MDRLNRIALSVLDRQLSRADMLLKYLVSEFDKGEVNKVLICKLVEASEIVDSIQKAVKDEWGYENQMPAMKVGDA